MTYCIALILCCRMGESRGTYWGNEHIFNRFPIFFYICFFLSSFSTRMVFKKINAHLIYAQGETLFNILY